MVGAGHFVAGEIFAPLRFAQLRFAQLRSIITSGFFARQALNSVTLRHNIATNFFGVMAFSPVVRGVGKEQRINNMIVGFLFGVKFRNIYRVCYKHGWCSLII